MILKWKFDLIHGEFNIEKVYISCINQKQGFSHLLSRGSRYLRTLARISLNWSLFTVSMYSLITFLAGFCWYIVLMNKRNREDGLCIFKVKTQLINDIRLINFKYLLVVDFLVEIRLVYACKMIGIVWSLQ